MLRLQWVYLVKHTVPGHDRGIIYIREGILHDGTNNSFSFFSEVVSFPKYCYIHIYLIQKYHKSVIVYFLYLHKWKSTSAKARVQYCDTKSDISYGETNL